jgi:hypothetical protein
MDPLLFNEQLRIKLPSTAEQEWNKGQRGFKSRRSAHNVHTIVAAVEHLMVSSNCQQKSLQQKIQMRMSLLTTLVTTIKLWIKCTSCMHCAAPIPLLWNCCYSKTNDNVAYDRATTTELRGCNI